MLLRTFTFDFRKVSDIKGRRVLLKLALTIKFSQNLNMERDRVATTLTLGIFLKGRIIYSHSVSGCCVLISIGNARSPIVK